MKTKALHILLLTDFSDNAWNAIVYALKLYVDQYCTFYFLHSTYISNAIAPHYINNLKEEALSKLLELKAQTDTANANANHNFKTLLFEDQLIDAVSKAVNENSLDIVVMGAKGATGTINYLFGSNAIRVANTIKHCPVLIVPDEHDFVTPTQIAFPTDFNHFYTNELNFIKNMADVFNSKIRVVHISTQKDLSNIQKYNLKTLEKQLVNYECSFHWLPDYATKAEAITEFIEEFGIELLAIVRYKHRFFEMLFNEAIIKKLVFQPKIPILVIPE